MTLESSSKKEHEKMLKDFDDLLESIESTNLKHKLLWRQIYKNAISDRQSANLCFMNLLPHVMKDSDKHAMLGVQLTKYLERMEKSNEQLIKLSNLVQKALEDKETEAEVSPHDLFQEMEKMRGQKG